MSVLAITWPCPIATLGGSMEGVDRLRSPDPREAAVSGAGARTIDVDLGAARRIDTVFLGHARGVTAALTVTGGQGGYADQQLGVVPIADSRIAADRRHYLLILPAPVLVRFVRISGIFPAGAELGTLAIGQSIRPTLGHEWGGGRFVIDTGFATRLPGGGFSFDPGARAGGWEWTMGDLDDAEVDALYGLQLAVGTSATILAIEDPDPRPGLNEAIHWGVLTRLQPSERRDVGVTRWSMRVEDWA